jgi:hypothetical protein
MADNDPSPKWQAFVKTYQQHAKTGYFKNAFASPSLSGINYYNAADAIFKVLDQVNGSERRQQKVPRCAAGHRARRSKWKSFT